MENLSSPRISPPTKIALLRQINWLQRQDELYRRKPVLKSPMRSLGVVPDEPVNQLPVKEVNIEQKVGVIVDELVLKGSVESFQMRVLLGSFRVGVIMDKVQLF